MNFNVTNLTVIDSDLVPVYETSEGEKVVYGSELHAVLGVKTPYRTWSERRLEECDGVESLDYQAVQICTPGNPTPKKDHIILLDLAKEMAMLERNEKGKETRRYFIEVEKKYKKTLTTAEMFFQNAKIMVEQEKRIAYIEDKQKEMSSGLERVEDRLNAVEVRLNPTPGMDEYYAIAGYVSLMKYMVKPDDYKKLGKEAKKLSQEKGYAISSIPHPAYGRVGSYHIDILREVFSRYFATK